MGRDAMLIDGVPSRTITADLGHRAVEILDQTLLPNQVHRVTLGSVDAVAHAIRSMQVRGAPLIGATAAYGMALAASAEPSDDGLRSAAEVLAATRPTAVNLRWALDRMLGVLLRTGCNKRPVAAWAEAAAIAESDVEVNTRLGAHGLALLRGLTPRSGGRRVEVMTHCNAGWLATVDRGTALSPVYAAVEAGIDVHVWVSETRPRNQGLLTAWELRQQGIPHTVIADNAAGTLIAAGRVDAVLVGADRIAANGDVANKVGTFLKALACADADIPFYVVAPVSTVDLACPDGSAIPIEERDAAEVREVHGVNGAGDPASVRVVDPDSAVANPAFDVTPARLVTAIVTERGALVPAQLGSALEA
jgi:methylthioribose-1-phosphate isomerase